MSTADYGYGPLARHHDIELDEEKCWSLLGSSGIGRFAFAANGRIQVFPVHYIVLRGSIFFRTSRDGAIASAIPQEGTAFETDAATPSTQAGWSVLVTGPAHAVDEDALATELFGQIAEEPWAGGIRDLFVQVTPHELTGRRVFLA